LGLDNGIYRIEVEFPYRVFSNCGQDSIARPTIGKDGIPFLPGSSVKGLFKRACTPEQAVQYCGDARDRDHLKPGDLRFHGAYPIGDWSDRIVDLVHPQQDRQIGTPTSKSASAFALISFYKPRFVFEFSSQKVETNWKEVERILLAALQLGTAGKTSSGYGLGGNFAGKPPINPYAPISVLLQGQGASSVLRDGTPEFRPNLFKASLRGHVKRLLGGVSNVEQNINEVVDNWFGKTDHPAKVKLVWQEREPTTFQDVGLEQRNPTYRVKGLLYLDILKRKPRRDEDQKQVEAEYQSDLEFLQQVLQFAYVMGGFGKSWRRVSHEVFLPRYHEQHFEIGCHWQSPDFDQIQTPQQLRQFLEQLHQTCCQRMRVREAQPSLWREAWHPKRVAVFCKIGNQSEAVNLFHNETFKTTVAIGGRVPHSKHPKRFNPPSDVSSVWHRMLPLKNSQFLEIVTVFHDDRSPWKRDQVDQLDPFLDAIARQGFDLTWGNKPT
jgi:CRISPR-associated protein Cmr6